MERTKSKMIHLLGQVPSKKNSRINTRSGRSFPSKRYTEWHKDAMAQIIEQVTVPSKNLAYPVKIEYMFLEKDNRRRDISNQLESINDLLVDAGVLEDDSWQHINHISARAALANNKEECGCTIVILSE